MVEGAASIIGKIFEQAATKEPMHLVGWPLRDLWSEGKWTAEAIQAGLEKVVEGLLMEEDQ